MVMGKGRGGVEEVSNVFSVKFSLSLATCCQQLEHVPLQVDNSCSTNSLLCLHTANIERVNFFSFFAELWVTRMKGGRCQ